MSAPKLIPAGAHCLNCGVLGPDLVMSPLPAGATVEVKFACGRCGAEWVWEVRGGTERQTYIARL